jgi:hypothetical protein
MFVGVGEGCCRVYGVSRAQQTDRSLRFDEEVSKGTLMKRRAAMPKDDANEEERKDRIQTSSL